MSASVTPTVVLLAAPRGHGLEEQLAGQHCGILLADSGQELIRMANDYRPDLIILAPQLPDMPATDACRLLQQDPRIGHNIPTLILTAEPPTPEQRVSALRSGAWDFLRYPINDLELTLRLQAYVQAKRNLDVALAEGLVDPSTGLHNRPGLARRARELGALLTRQHGALACVVFAVAPELADAKIPRFMAGAVRLSDVVASLEPMTIAILAPGTDHGGAVKLARRLTSALRDWLGVAALVDGQPPVRVGYEAVANLKYAPLDPVNLLLRAINAVHDGAPEAQEPWVRRSSGGNPSPLGLTSARSV